MIEKRLIQWYAANAGVDLDIAEREVILTYASDVCDHLVWLLFLRPKLFAKDVN